MIEEDEYIADISGSVGFATTQYAINPGQASTFPWGSKIASLYEKYEFQFLEFYYRREVSEFATNGQAGKVMLSVDFDASDGPPSTKQQVLDTDPHVDAMPCAESIVLSVNCAQMRSQDSKYVRPGAQPPNTDIKTYDSGSLFVSTYGNTNTSVVGELRVRYRCLVSVPVLESGLPQSGTAGSFLALTSSLSGETAGNTTVANVLFASTTNPIVLANGIGATVGTTGLITLNPGSYLIEVANTTWDSAAGISAGQLYLSTTNGTGGTIISSSEFGSELASEANTTFGHSAWITSMQNFLYNTTVWGTSLYVLAVATYASGTAYNQGQIQITQL